MTHYAYTYTVLRYVHDTTTGEFVNVGVGIHAPQASYAGGLFRTTYSRLVKTFPGTNGEYFRGIMRHVQSQFDLIREQAEGALPLSRMTNAMDIARGVLPQDDSALQWGPMGSGLTEDPAKTLEQLFQRMVCQYDEQNTKERRSEADVWRLFKRKLEEKQILHRFAPKKIAVEDDEVEFEHAWKNGVWHCLEPVSFDLGSGDSIRDKAHRWLGQISSVKDSPDRFKLYLLVGPPQDGTLNDAYANALSILEKIPADKSIVQESEATQLVGALEQEIEEHETK